MSLVIDMRCSCGVDLGDPRADLGPGTITMTTTLDTISFRHTACQRRGRKHLIDLPGGGHDQVLDDFGD
jgi:hypothetical protein